MPENHVSRAPAIEIEDRTIPNCHCWIIYHQNCRLPSPDQPRRANPPSRWQGRASGRHGGECRWLQVFSNWHLLTARPSEQEESIAPHVLYGHVGPKTAYSVGHWLCDIAPLLAGPYRPIITGGTGALISLL